MYTSNSEKCHAQHVSSYGLKLGVHIRASFPSEQTAVALLFSSALPVSQNVFCASLICTKQSLNFIALRIAADDHFAGNTTVVLRSFYVACFTIYVEFFSFVTNECNKKSNCVCILGLMLDFFMQGLTLMLITKTNKPAIPFILFLEM